MMNANVTELETDRGSVGESRLWQAVIVSAILDWKSGPLRLQCRAGDYLFEDEKDFPLVCHLAGMNAEHLRAKLTKLRGQVRHDDHLIAA
jgi:hypothetical protein